MIKKHKKNKCHITNKDDLLKELNALLGLSSALDKDIHSLKECDEEIFKDPYKISCLIFALYYRYQALLHVHPAFKKLCGNIPLDSSKLKHQL